MITFLYVVYVLVCLFLILVVLLQAGRGGMGAAFGGSSQTVFGGSGAGNFLTKLTVIVAALFMMLSATLTYVSSSGEQSLEAATERVRLREEARSGKDKKDKEDKKESGNKGDGKVEGAAAPQSTSESAPSGGETAAPAEGPSQTAPSTSSDAPANEGAAEREKSQDAPPPAAPH